ncbi:cupin domain-containing protein [Aureimonas sp. OT7]|uniref:cupin domain-containing protein n=1 Tax=Aureimonas sp. OT7 TaxID=2816454 RepID=UPI00177D1D22|nr:cupin domain-containing protein [Aureimonas sp. OT7]QOG07410.1 cupin domain-containing protein [Aureimonas sp. OT7]
MKAAGSDVVRIGSLELRFLVDETVGSGNLVMFEFSVPPSARVPAPHFHKDVDEVVYGIEGVTTTTLDGRKHELGPGQSLFVPRGSVHTHENLHDEKARSLIVMSPGSIGRRYFKEIASEVNVPGTPDLSKVKEIMLRHGLVPA